ncbi:syntaxin-12-like [Lethenteron reissneri]|uniref:syntaxin-12-like n=1 Tax=Lethenteron reissneri TaxID=7753 RepID=UPI002AB660D5|nr:syntaxin-12-like [Lethenteron reissneri]
MSGFPGSDGGYTSYRQATNGDLDFSGLAQIISTNIQKISQNTAQIQKLVSQLGTAQDTTHLLERLQQLQQSANQLAKETNKYLKDLGSLPTPSSQSEQRHRKIQRDRLMNEFSTALNNFQTTQRRAAERERESVARARANSRQSQGGNYLDETATRDGHLVNVGEGFEDRTLQSQAQDEGITEEDLEEIKEREVAIQMLEADIMDINQIFKDLGTMIHEQGDMIDSIEANVETAEVHVEQANQQLRRAAQYQTASRKKICIILVMLAVVVAIVGIIIWQATK